MSDRPRGREARQRGRVSQSAKRIDENPALVRMGRWLRERLPGDSGFGDPLSTSGDEPVNVVGRRVVELSGERPSALRDAGLAALQVWQAVSEAQGRGRGDDELTIMFTDLVGFSDWALRVGDDVAVVLLRQVGEIDEREVRAGHGRVVKRLGDGVMAVFDDPAGALAAAGRIQARVRELECDGWSPRVRAGLHLGRPRPLGGDFFGVDVNIAARVAAAADGDEVLISETVRERIGDEGIKLKRRWFFRAKGTPDDVKVYVATLRDDSTAAQG
jgi:adenylate cyclase